MRSDVSVPTRTGRFTVPYTQSLQHFCTETTQTLIHPDYFDHQANWYRLISLDGKPVTISVSPEGCVHWSCRDAIESAKVQEVVHRLLISFPLPEDAKKPLPRELEMRFCSLYPLVHITSLSLGEALMKAIIRQVITANHAKKLTDAFIRRYGERQIYDGKTYHDFPSLETIAKISLEDLQTEGLGFKAKVVQWTARSLLENDLEAKIAHMAPQEALALLTSIKGIGRWTAHVALCDWLADWSYYPFEDLAVRTWARKLWRGVQWPQDERQFAAHWQHINGDHTGAITFYLLSCAATRQTPHPYAQEVLF
jgi:3-methyladenine DNA glycosylase/8-oxoguanine DNA glycosylase